MVIPQLVLDITRLVTTLLFLSPIHSLHISPLHSTCLDSFLQGSVSNIDTLPLASLLYLLC